MSEDRNILLIGGGGYLGSVLTPMLLSSGHKVTVFDKFYFGQEMLASVAAHPSLTIVQGDVRTFAPSLLDGVDAVLYMAALSNDPICELDPSWTAAVNRDAAVHIARLAKEHGVKRFLFSSSCSVYGAGGSKILTEDSELNPVSTYASTKIEAESQILGLRAGELLPGSAAQGDAFRAVSADALRSCHQHHDPARGDQEPHLRDRRGEQHRPFLHVEDAARAYIVCMTAPAERITGRAFNVLARNFKIPGVGGGGERSHRRRGPHRARRRRQAGLLRVRQTV